MISQRHSMSCSSATWVDTRAQMNMLEGTRTTFGKCFRNLFGQNTVSYTHLDVYKRQIVNSHDGFVKILADAKYGEILGVHIIGPQATELIAEAVAVMELEGTVDELMFTIHAHPTLSEAMLDAYGAVEGMAINA